ncbi:MAG: ACT domain-containing protein [Clostridia bacterium]|nr:ACT domain-containing protein [Clostridia bacterium]
MFIKQLSIFIENKVGRLQAIMDTLSENNINIRALSIAETTEFGILRIITPDVEKAKQVLREVDVISKITDVIAVYIDDKAGGLAKMLKSITDAEINVEYMYAFLGRTEGKALMVLKADDEAKAEKALLASGMELASPDII